MRPDRRRGDDAPHGGRPGSGASPLAVLLMLVGSFGWTALLVSGGRSETLVAGCATNVVDLCDRRRRVRLGSAPVVLAGPVLTRGSRGWVSLPVTGGGFAGTAAAGVRLWPCGVGLEASRR